MITVRQVLRTVAGSLVFTLVLGVCAVAQEKVASPGQAPTKPNEPIVHDLPADVPGHTEFLDYKDGFRGMKFGTSVSDFKGLTPYRDRGTVKAYKKADDDLNIGNVTAQEIIYIFVHDKFYAVSIHADQANGRNLLKIFQAAFGPGAHPDGPQSQWFWTGKVASAHFYEDANADHDVRGWIGNNEIQKEYESAMKDIFMAAAQQL
jgi:hypothetical protein